MTIQSLEHTDLASIVACLLEAFKDYSVKMPDSLSYWEKRFKGARVDLALSFGVFDQNRLVGFIINGIDHQQGYLTAFNTGTGILEKYRGQQLVDQLYQQAIPILKTKGIKKCSLEVIQTNHRALHVYERIGFRILRNLRCFKGDIQATDLDVNNRKISLTEYFVRSYPHHDLYSWDHCKSAVKLLADYYEAYLVMDVAETVRGQFIIDENNGGYLAQLWAQPEDLKYLFAGIRKISPSVRLNNLDETRHDLLLALLDHGIENPVDQYEMEMWI